MHLDSIFKPILRVMLAALFVVPASPMSAQVAPAVSGRGFPLSVGVGFSYFDLNWGSDTNGTARRMGGVAAWLDYDVPHTPSVLRGLSLEVEGHHIAYLRPSDLTTMQQDTFGAGPTYKWRRYRRFHPFAKFMIGMGSIDFPALPNAPPTYRHDTRTVYAPGGGLEYRAYGNLWVRGDYEYQFWPKIFGAGTLNPNGYTFGVVYDFRGIGFRGGERP